MKYYNDFNAMFNAQSGLKNDLSVFNDFGTVLNSFNWRMASLDSGVDYLLKNAWDEIALWVRDGVIDVPEANTPGDWLAWWSELDTEVCDAVHDSFVHEFDDSATIDDFLFFCYRNGVCTDVFHSQDEYDSSFTKYIRGNMSEKEKTDFLDGALSSSYFMPLWDRISDEIPSQYKRWCEIKPVED